MHPVTRLPPAGQAASGPVGPPPACPRRASIALALLALIACAGDEGGDAGGAAEIVVSPASLTFTVPSGDPLPPARDAQVTSADGRAVNDLVVAVSHPGSGPADWLGANLASTGSPTTLSVRPQRSDLPPGEYAATVLVSSTAVGVTPASLDVTYAVTPGPAIGLVPAALAFTAAAGAPQTATQLVEVQNVAGGSLDGLSMQVRYAAGEPTGWLFVFLGAASAPTALLVRANPGALAPGTYAATIEVASPRASNTPQSVAVTLTVTPAALR